MKYDAIIVGGGHNGLVAGGYLARAGLRVRIVERRHIVGGPCAAVEYFPGYWAAISNSPGSFEPKIVADLELARYGLEFTKPDPSLVMPFPDGRAFVARRDPAATHAELAKFSAADADAYYEFFDYLEAFARVLDISLFEPPPTIRELTSRLKTPAHEEAFARIFFGSIRDLLDERFESDQVKAVIAILSVMTNLVGPSTPGTPLTLLQRPLSIVSSKLDAAHDPRKQPLRGSTGLPVGGMGAITKALAASFTAHGGEIRTDAEVAAIMVRDGRTTGVALRSGEQLDATFVLSNANPKTTFLDLIDKSDLDAESRRTIENLPMRGSAFKVGLALDGLPRFAAARGREEEHSFAGCQFRISPSMDSMERAYDDVKYGRWSREPMLWGLTPSVADPNLAPDGKHLMSVNVFHAPLELSDGKSWRTEKEEFGKHCIRVLTEYIPNLESIITDYRFWGPDDFESEFGLVGANITHGDHTPASMFGLRPVPSMSR